MQKSRPVLFSREMSLAVLDGRKNQTRRADKDTHSPEFTWNGRMFTHPRGFVLSKKCPYGSVGDYLWVREEHYRFGHWEPVEGVLTKGGKQKWKFVADHETVCFDPPALHRKSMNKKTPELPSWYKRIARFMPKSLSRTTLEITGVRYERLHEISEEDARDEGCEMVGVETGEIGYTGHPIEVGSYSACFYELWESINGAGSWDANPFVWVIDFKQVRP